MKWRNAKDFYSSIADENGIEEILKKNVLDSFRFQKKPKNRNTFTNYDVTETCSF